MTFIDFGSTGEFIKPFWLRFVDAGRTAEALRASWLEHLQLRGKSLRVGALDCCAHPGDVI